MYTHKISSRLQWKRLFGDIFELSPIRLIVFVALNRFEHIIAALLFTYILPPYFKDELSEILNIVVVWNNCMGYNLIHPCGCIF